MTIKETHDLILFELNKSEYGYISHSEIDDVLDRAQMEEFKFLLGDEREFSAGNAIGRTSFGISQSLNNALNPFISVVEYNNTEYNGSNNGTALASVNQNDPAYLVLPSDWVYTLEWVKSDGARFEVIPQGKISSRVRSNINTGEFITYAGEGGTFNGFSFSTPSYRRYNRPSGTGGITVTLHYLKRPAKPNFSYTQSGRVITHNAGASTDLEWDDLHVNKIIVRALILLGINVENQSVIALNNQKNKD
jgi:hypothetical protein